MVEPRLAYGYRKVSEGPAANSANHRELFVIIRVIRAIRGSVPGSPSRAFTSVTFNVPREQGVCVKNVIGLEASLFLSNNLAAVRQPDCDIR